MNYLGLNFEDSTIEEVKSFIDQLSDADLQLAYTQLDIDRSFSLQDVREILLEVFTTY